ncbi:hypothetical protein U1Q18_027685 [Sarracenia purpurea var. burkii]
MGAFLSYQTDQIPTKRKALQYRSKSIQGRTQELSSTKNKIQGYKNAKERNQIRNFQPPNDPITRPNHQVNHLTKQERAKSKSSDNPYQIKSNRINLQSSTANLKTRHAQPHQNSNRKPHQSKTQNQHQKLKAQIRNAKPTSEINFPNQKKIFF